MKEPADFKITKALLERKFQRGNGRITDRS